MRIISLKNKKKIIILLVYTFFSIVAVGQNYPEKFNQLLFDDDTTEIKILLNDWEENNSNDAEFYTSAFSFYSQKDLDKAFKYMDKGIEKFPDRLDMRFFKCLLLQEIGDFENFTNEVIKVVEYSKINNNNWLWLYPETEEVEDGENFMFKEIIIFCFDKLFDVKDKSLLFYMIQIGESILKYYPEKEFVLIATSVALMETNQYDKAFEYLKKAEQFAESPYSMLFGNLAVCYTVKGDKKNAIKYYKLIEKYGDEQEKERAKKCIKQLKKQKYVTK